MPRQDIEFKTADNVTLRGWLVTPAGSSGRLPCLVMCHGFSAVKEMELDRISEYFTSKLPMACLVYDNRGFGSSDTKEGQPRYEILAAQQLSDFSDAITYAQTLSQVDLDKIAIWGGSFSGGHALWLGATDRRVKAVLSQCPIVDGWQTFHRSIRPDMIEVLNKAFQDDRIARASGKPATMLPVVDSDPIKPSALSSADSYEFFRVWEAKSSWKNEVTAKSLEAIREYVPAVHIQHISPTPLLLTVAAKDVVTPPDIALEAYARALEPKQLNLLQCGHFGPYSEDIFEKNLGVQAEFLKTHLLSL